MDCKRRRMQIGMPIRFIQYLCLTFSKFVPARKVAAGLIIGPWKCIAAMSCWLGSLMAEALSWPIDNILPVSLGLTPGCRV